MRGRYAVRSVSEQNIVGTLPPKQNNVGARAPCAPPVPPPMSLVSGLSLQRFAVPTVGDNKTWYKMFTNIDLQIALQYISFACL